MSESPFILGINGSPHYDGVVAELMNCVLEAARAAGARTAVINLYDLHSVPTQGLYSQNPKLETIENTPEDDITRLYPEIIKADGFVFATPVYWANMSAKMKDFIEHLTPLENDGFKLQGKVAACIAASKENEGGVEMAALSLLAPLTQMGMLIPPNAVMWAPGEWSSSTQHYESWAHEDAPIVGKNMVRLISLLKENPIDWTGQSKD